MKHHILYLLLAAPLLLTSCSDDDEVVPVEEVTVTNHNLSGTWNAISWRGQSLPEGYSISITFVRSDQTFTMTQNVGSMYQQSFQGSYTLEQDEDTELWILSGTYAYDGGPWGHDYYVTRLTANQLTLTATDDAGDVTIYQRQ